MMHSEGGAMILSEMSATCVDINFSCSLANETPLSL
jgi:hypothetical protein